MNETMEQALAEMKRLLSGYEDGFYTVQETGDAIYLAWANCKERQELSNG